MNKKSRKDIENIHKCRILVGMKHGDIRAIRVKYELTQTAFARALGVSPQTVYFWERGATKPQVPYHIILHRLAAMATKPNEHALAKAALEAARFMKPDLEADAPAGKMALDVCGLGLLISRLFCNANNRQGAARWRK